MTITEKDGHTIITADSGNWVGKADRSCFGEAISLGINTDPSTIIEEPIDNWPQPQEQEQEQEPNNEEYEEID